MTNPQSPACLRIGRRLAGKGIETRRLIEGQLGGGFLGGALRELSGARVFSSPEQMDGDGLVVGVRVCLEGSRQARVIRPSDRDAQHPPDRLSRALWVYL